MQPVKRNYLSGYEQLKPTGNLTFSERADYLMEEAAYDMVQGKQKVHQDMAMDLITTFYDRDHLKHIKQDGSNYWWYNLISYFNLPTLTTLSNNHSMVSNFLAKHLANEIEQYLMTADPDMQKDFQEQYKQQRGQGQGQGQGSGQGQDPQDDSGDGEGQGGGQGDQQDQGDGNQDQQQGGQQGDEGNDPGQEGQTGGKQAGKGNNSQFGDNLEEKIEKWKNNMDDFAKKAVENMRQVLKREYSNLNQMENDIDLSNEVFPNKIQGAGFLSDRTVNSYKKLMRYLNMTDGCLEKFVKQTIRKAEGYFENGGTMEFEDLLESDTLDELDEVEMMLLDPRLALLVENIQRTGKVVFDLYIDFSGSMSSNINFSDQYNSFTYQGQAKNISCLDACKVLALRMMQLKRTELIWGFEYSPYALNDFGDFLQRSPSGGTDITTMIKRTQAMKRPAIILTDAEDSINYYSEYAYIINVSPGCAESHIRQYYRNQGGSQLAAMLGKGQYVFYIDNRLMNLQQMVGYLEAAGRKVR